jgi:hypothetical protein
VVINHNQLFLREKKMKIDRLIKQTRRTLDNGGCQFEYTMYSTPINIMGDRERLYCAHGIETSSLAELKARVATIT